jgi:4-hydroxy-tetrahydrodipicolinate synthase
LIDWHIAEGTDCIGVVGTTGESPTVSTEEHCEIIRVAVEQAARRVPIMAGCGANSTAEAIELTRFAQDVGADCHLQVVPYYNKPTQEGLYQHHKAVAEAVDIPQILYNVPGRTGVDLTNNTTLRLAEINNIVGIKDATGSIERGTDLIIRAPKDFAIYSGDDATGMALMLIGGKGVISVTANLAPKLMHEMCVAAMAGKTTEACAINTKLFALHQKLFVEANPIPVKWALNQMGLIGTGIRLPLVQFSASHHSEMLDAMKNANIH